MAVAILDFFPGLTWFPPLGAERTVTHSTTYNDWQWLYFQLSWTQFTISLLMLLELILCSSYNNTTKQPSCTCFNKALYCIKGIVQNWKFLISIFNQLHCIQHTAMENNDSWIYKFGRLFYHLCVITDNHSRRSPLLFCYLDDLWSVWLQRAVTVSPTMSAFSLSVSCLTQLNPESELCGLSWRKTDGLGSDD